MEKTYPAGLMWFRRDLDLKLSTGEFALVTKAHERRNDTSHVSPFPPVGVFFGSIGGRMRRPQAGTSMLQ